MKILGEKSLSSKVIVGLKGLFTIISIVDLLVIETIVKVIIELIGMENVEKSVASLILFIMIITTGIIALFIIYQFIKIFQHLKDSDLFCENNEYYKYILFCDKYYIFYYSNICYCNNNKIFSRICILYTVFSDNFSNNFLCCWNWNKNT